MQTFLKKNNLRNEKEAPRGMTGLRVNTYFERQNSNDFTVPNTVGDKHNTFLDSVCNTLSNKNYLKINNGLKI